MDSIPTRPPLNHADTTLVDALPTVGKNTAGKAQGVETTSNDPKYPGDAESNNPHAQATTTDSLNNAEALTKTSETSFLTSFHDIFVLAGIFTMLIWPWLFFGVVWHLRGIEMNTRAAKAVTDHPQATIYFVTLVGNIISLLVNFLFSIAIIRFAQKWVAKREHRDEQVTVFHVSLLSAFRNRNWPWKVTELQYLVSKQRWVPVALVGACIAAFAFVPSGMTSLLSPVPFNLTTGLNGVELDLSSTAVDCLEWFDANPISNNCDWKTYNGLEYTTCLGENQLVDVLESGRGNILSLVTNNTEGLVFTQLGAEDGLHFLGPIRGVLPMGPKGVPAFNTVQPSPPLPERPYNYTLEHQGLNSNVSCIYDSQSPIKKSVVDSPAFVLQYNGECPQGTTDFLTPSGVKQYLSVNSNNSLTFWACETPSYQGQEASYSIYLRGGGRFYQDAIGNITCTVSPIRPAQFRVFYQSKAKIFTSLRHDESSTARFVNSVVIEKAVASVGTAVQELQNFQTNLLAESVLTFGVKSFKLEPYGRADGYLQLYAAMIQGILEYQLTYNRLIYSTFPNRPESCNRKVNGTFSYETVGWKVAQENIGFLLPVTIINIAALTVILVAIFIEWPAVRHYEIDPTDPNSLIMANHDLAKTVEPNEWNDSVTYQPRRVLQAAAGQLLTAEPEKVAQGVTASALQ